MRLKPASQSLGSGRVGRPLSDAADSAIATASGIAWSAIWKRSAIASTRAGSCAPRSPSAAAMASRRSSMLGAGSDATTMPSVPVSVSSRAAFRATR
jgi:hypothetical protein